MPSSLTTLLPPALGFSPHPPVSVYGTGPCYTIVAFLDRKGPQLHYFISLRITPSSYAGRIFQPCDYLHRTFHSRLCFPSRVPAVLITRGAGILNLLSIGYASLPLLNSDLPRADQLYSGNLGYSAARIPTLLSLLIPAFSLLSSPHPLPVMLRSPKNAPLPTLTGSAASVWCFSPGHFRRRTSRPVSCYALF